MSLADQRRDYRSPGLSEEEAGADPLALWWRWYADAEVMYEPNATVLSTTGLDGGPRVRTVLLKGLTEQGFVFFTNYASDKAAEIARDPRCGLLFGWFDLHRQVRISGRAEKVSREDSQAYFATRPRGSQLGAWASIEAGGQSRPVADRGSLDAALTAVEERFADQEVPCPDQWGGFCVVPESVEFWQGATGRLHDRLLFTRAGDGWQRQRLAP